MIIITPVLAEAEGRTNLAVNPSGEQNFNLAWAATNGSVESTSNPLVLGAVTPFAGSKVIQYTVLTHGSAGYRVTPHGPADTVHLGAFKINPDTGQVAASVRVASKEALWLQPMVRFLRYGDEQFTTVSSVNFGEPMYHSGDDQWVELRIAGTADSSATHWLFDVTVFANDPRLDSVTPPSIGSTLFLDAAYVPQSGVFLFPDQYFDGSTAGAYWSGTPHSSISHYGDAPVVDPGDNDSDTGGVDPGESTGDTDDSEVVTEPPINPPLPLTFSDETGTPQLEVLTPVKAAERILSRTTAGGICLNEDVQIGDLVLNRLDAAGVLWIVTDIENWWTLPEPDIPDFPRGRDDGSYEARGRYSARVFTLNGSFFPSSQSQVPAARDQLIRSVNLCHTGAWFMTHETDATRASRTWLSGQPMITTVNISGRTDFSIGLKAPDPVKYGLKDRALPGWYSVQMSSQSVGNPTIGRTYDRTYPWAYPKDESRSTQATSATAVNTGNTSVSPILTLHGPTGGVSRIMNVTTGQQMRVVRKLYAGDELTIDCQKKTVTLNGVVNQRWYLEVVLDWIYLQPGENTLFWVDESAPSGGTLKVEWRPGWIG